MDFNKWLKEGIPYTLVDDAETTAHAFQEKYARKDQEAKEKEFGRGESERARVNRDRVRAYLSCISILRLLNGIAYLHGTSE